MIIFICYYNRNTRLNYLNPRLTLLIRDLLKSQAISCQLDFNSCFSLKTDQHFCNLHPQTIFAARTTHHATKNFPRQFLIQLFQTIVVTFHEVFTGQGNSKLLPVRAFDVDVLQITFHLFEDTNSNDCEISLGKFAWNALWHLRIFSTNRKYNLAPNDNHLDGYEYFIFKFLSSLLVLLLFLFGFYFFLNIKRRVSWWRSSILHERRHCLESLMPRYSSGEER